ncbi:hypothetical protein D348_00214 [Enterococcus faecalis SLO2C-1]|nr:hypothetical protein D348_00214 [Enterococcus faecalis SLO2C-1]
MYNQFHLISISFLLNNIFNKSTYRLFLDILFNYLKYIYLNK